MSFCEHCTEVEKNQSDDYDGDEMHIQSLTVYTTSAPVTVEGVVILIISDIFGLKLINNKQLADRFGRAGIKTYLPDLFNGDAIHPDDEERRTKLPDWFKRHDPIAKTDLLSQRIIPFLRAAYPGQKIVALGFCYGGRIAVELAYRGEVDIISIAHPSLLTLPDHMQQLHDLTSCPVQIHTCDVDPQFPSEFFEVVDKMFQDRGNRYERCHWAGCTHGFSVRGDLSNPVIKAAQDGVFNKMLEFAKTSF